MLVPADTYQKRKLQVTPQLAGAVLIPLALAVILVGTVQPVPGALVGYGPGSSAWQPSYGDFIYVGEGMNSSVAISRLANGTLNYHNAGKVQASSEPQDLQARADARAPDHLDSREPEESRW